MRPCRASATRCHARRCPSTRTAPASSPTGSTAGTASRRAGRCSPRFPNGRVGRRAAVVQEPRRVARGGLADHPRRHRHRWSARRSSPRSTRTRRDVDEARPDHPAARAPPPARTLRGRDPQHGQGGRRHADLPVSAGFAALRDGKGFDHPRYAEIAQRCGDDLPASSRRSASTSAELVLAWDFVTASDEFLRSDLTTMRAAALPAIGTNGANLTFTATAQPATAHGVQELPRHVQVARLPRPPARPTSRSCAAAPTACPVMQGMRDAQFAAIIPDCVQTQPLPRPTIIFGHGLFGSAKEYLANDFVQQLAEDHCFVIIAGDFIGLTSRQLAARAARGQRHESRPTDHREARAVDHRLHLARVGRARSDGASPRVQVQRPGRDRPGADLLRRRIARRDHGQHVHGLRPEHHARACSRCPAAIWSMLLERSAAWFALLGAAQGSYHDPAVYELNVAFLGFGDGALRSDHDRRARDQGSAVRQPAEEHLDLVHARRLPRDQHLDGDRAARDGRWT